jgi:UDP-glucose 4-epimerase
MTGPGFGPLEGKRVLIVGGTGSLGQVLLRRLLAGNAGKLARLVILSRDEGKQHQIRLDLQNLRTATDEIIYQSARSMLEFRIGDVRDYTSVSTALRDIDVVFNTAAMKQVPTCEYFPYEAVLTNVAGPENIVRAIRDLRLPVETVVAISTDKAVKPVNVMGMTKALQERVILRASLDVPETRFIAARYGNVLASRGSVIPLFHEQIRNGGPVTITHPEMTRFLLSLEEAVSVIIAAVAEARTSEIYVPQIPSARVVDVAAALIGDRPIKTVITGIRPGEKLHEVLISEEESHRAFERGDHYVIGSLLPELRGAALAAPFKGREYSSADHVLSVAEVRDLLRRHALLVGSERARNGAELLA